MRYLSMTALVCGFLCSPTNYTMHHITKRMYSYYNHLLPLKADQRALLKQQIAQLPIDQKYKNDLESHLENPDPKQYMNRLKWILSLPWNRYTKERYSIKQIQKSLDASHYGMQAVKEKILDFMAMRKLASTKKLQTISPILCLAGPPGIGKTAICKSIAQGIHRHYGRIALSGVHDETIIRGHDSVYVGASPGRIIKTIKESQVMNPLILLDEIDKVGRSHRGSVEDALLEALDPSQNKEFVDHYIGIPIDLSQVFFIATANYLEQISPPLRDRMEIIQLPAYTVQEKMHIAQQYMIRQHAAQMGLDHVPVISNDVVHAIISQYTDEQGVRGLSRCLQALCAKTARAIVEEKPLPNFTPATLHKYLGPAPRTATKIFGFH